MILSPRQSLRIAVLTALVVPIKSEVISKATIRQEQLHKANGQTEAVYNDYLVVNLTVEHLPESSEESVMLTKLMGDTNGEQQLVHPIEILIRRENSYARYPLQYISSVHGKPIENYIHTNTFECNMLARKIGLNSGAFCCRCSISSIAGMYKQRSLRNVTKCQFGKLDAIVSYMSYSDDDIYHVHEILEPVIVHSVIVNIKVGDVYTARNVSIGTLRPSVVYDDVTVTYHADFPASIMPPSFSSKYVAVAKEKNQTPPSCILDREMFSLSGLDCNRIGVSGEAFQHQPLRCEANIGSCLHGQIRNHEEIAIMRRKHGLRSSFYLEDFGTFLGFTHSYPSMDYRLKEQKLVSLVTIKTLFSGDILTKSDFLKKIEFLGVNVSQASHIRHNGSIHISLDARNTGDTIGSVYFYCDENSTLFIAPVSVRFFPQETRRLFFHGISQTLTNASLINNFTECKLVASNAKGECIATRSIRWTQVEASAKSPYPNEKLMRSPSVLARQSNRTLGVAELKSCFNCPKYLPLCFFVRVCFWRAFTAFLAIFLLMLLIVEQVEGLYKYRRN